MVNMFLLDRKVNYNYYTCCRNIHCELALFLLILLSIFFQVGSLWAYINNPKNTYADIEIFFEGIELIITSCTIAAFVNKNAKLLIPFMFQLFMVVIVSMINTFRVAFCVLMPNSDMYDDLLDPPAILNTSERRYYALFFLPIMTLSCTFVSWCLHVILTCYKYYEDKAAERRTRENRPPVRFDDNVRPPMVVKEPKMPPSFPNPNFSVEDDDEDHIYSSTNLSPSIA